MADWQYTPTKWKGTSLSGGNLSVKFRDANSPLSSSHPHAPVETEIPGLGTRHVRSQPQPTVWELHVFLTAIDETDLDGFFKLFNAGDGLKTLLIDDSAGTTYRVSCAIMEIRKVYLSYFIVVLRVPDPVLEEDSEDSDDQSNKAGDSAAFTVANSGSRETLPTITIDPDNVKAAILADYKYSLRGFWSNHAPSPWNNLPIQLLDDGGAPDTVNHDAIVTQEKRAEVADGGSGLTDSQTTIGYDLGESGNPPTAGIIIIGTEQITYTGGGGGASGTLTGCTRGVGGTTVATHSENDSILFSEGLANGDDIRVWWNGVEIDRWLAGVNTTTMKCWVNAYAPARARLTLKSAITSGSPADAGEMEFNESTAILPPRGVIHIADEVISYQSRSGNKIKTIERGAWGATAASASAGDAAYRVDALYVISSGKGDAGTASAPASRRPAPQLPGSTNKLWKYGDTGDDASTVYYAATTPNRSAMFAPANKQAADDLAPALQQEDASAAKWKDADAIAGLPARNQLTLTLPQEVKADSNAIVYDANPQSNNILLRLIGLDRDGRELPLAGTYNIRDAAATSQNITPDDPLTTIIIRASHHAVLGANEDDESSGFALMTLSTHKVWQKFVLDQASKIKSVQVRAREGGDPVYEVTCEIVDGATGSDPPEDSTVVMDNFSIVDGSTKTADTMEMDEYIAATPKVLPAGTYWLFFYFSDYTSGQYRIAGDTPPTTRHDQYQKDASTSPVTGSIFFRVCHETDEDGPVQADTDEINESESAAIDKLELNMNDAAADPRTPYVHKMGDFANGLYHAVGNIANSTLGDQIDFDVWLSLTATFEINCKDRTVVYTDGNHIWSLPAAITPDNLAKWLPLAAGDNSIIYTDPGMVSTDIQFRHRGVRV